MTTETIITSVLLPIILALITSICVASMNLRAAAKADKEKREFERNDFIIRELYAILADIVVLRDFIFPPVNDSGLSIITEAPERRRAILKLLYRLKPLLKTNLRQIIDDSLRNEEEKFTVSFTNERTDITDRAWVDSLVQLYNTLNDCVDKQISELLN
jgi:hypothetical protein